MTDDISLTGEERATMKARANAWRGDCEQALKAALLDSDVTLEALVEIAWNATVERVSPADPEARLARQRLGKELWPERDDIRLFWRVLYSFVALEDSIDHTIMTGSAGGLMLLLMAVGPLPDGRLEGFFPKLRHHRDWPWHKHVAQMLVERSVQELRQRGAVPHDPILRMGAVGTFRDIGVKLDRICSDGTLWLVGRDREGHMRLFDLHDGECRDDGKGFCPSRLDATLFTLPSGTRA